jgi:hypothetical protein
VLQSPIQGRFQTAPVPSDYALLGQLPLRLLPRCRFPAAPGSASPRMRLTALPLSLSHPLDEVQSIFSSPLALPSLCSSSHTECRHRRERHRCTSSTGVATLVRRAESSLSVPLPQATAPGSVLKDTLAAFAVEKRQHADRHLRPRNRPTNPSTSSTPMRISSTNH